MSWKKQMAEDTVLRGMIVLLRQPELQELLGFVGGDQEGSVEVLQLRALDLLRHRSATINAKIRELFRPSVNQQGQSPPQPMPAPPPPQAIPPQQENHLSEESRSGAESPEIKIDDPPASESPDLVEVAYFPANRPIIMTELGFYDTLCCLVRPTLLVRHSPRRFSEGKFVIRLSKSQARVILRSRGLRAAAAAISPVEVQLRLCDSWSRPQYHDALPPQLVVHVNGHVVPIPISVPANPALKPKQVAGPINLTPFLHLKANVTNVLALSWNSRMINHFAVSVNLVRRVSARELVDRLSYRQIVPPYYTVTAIQHILMADDNSDITATSHRLSLCCPISRTRVGIPCRGARCKHLQCFDGAAFVHMNERKPTWECPVCGIQARFSQLEVDGYFVSILGNEMLGDCSEVEVYNDGSWSPVKPRQIAVSEPEVIAIVDDDDDNPGAPSCGNSVPVNGRNCIVIDLTGDSGDECSNAEYFG